MNDKDAEKPNETERNLCQMMCCILRVTKQKQTWNVTEGTHFILRHYEMENGEALLNLHAKFIGTFHFEYCDIKALSL